MYFGSTGSTGGNTGYFGLGLGSSGPASPYRYTLEEWVQYEMPAYAHRCDNRLVREARRRIPDWAEAQRAADAEPITVEDVIQVGPIESSRVPRADVILPGSPDELHALMVHFGWAAPRAVRARVVERLRMIRAACAETDAEVMVHCDKAMANSYIPKPPKEES